MKKKKFTDNAAFAEHQNFSPIIKCNAPIFEREKLYRLDITEFPHNGGQFHPIFVIKLHGKPNLEQSGCSRKSMRINWSKIEVATNPH